MLDFKRSDGPKAKLQFLQHVDEFLAVDQLDRWSSIAGCFAFRFLCERASRDDDPLVCTTRHGAAKVAHLRWRNRLGVAFALKQDLEGHEWVDLKNSKAVNSTVATLASYDNLSEAGLTENSLGQPLEAGRWQSQHGFQNFFAIVV